MANLILVDVAGSPPQFRFRLAGTDIVARYGAELTEEPGQSISAATAAIREQYRRGPSERTPTYCRHFIETKQHKYLRYERLLMPLSADGSTVNMLLGGIYPAAARDRRRSGQR